MLCVCFRTVSSLTDTDPVYTAGPPEITSIVAYSKGFACACGPGSVNLFEKTDDKDFFKKAREIKVSLLLTAIHWVVISKGC